VVGEVRQHEVAEHYRQADAFVFPSLCDGFGIVMLEAMACGLPVVATPNCGGPDLIEEGRSGFVVPIRDVQALADRITWLIAHRRDLPEMGAAGRARVAAQFTLEQYGAHLSDTYRRLAGGARRPEGVRG